MTSNGESITGKYYFKKDKTRNEITRDGEKFITITRMDKKIIWNLMPEQSMYMELPYDINRVMNEVPKDKHPGEIERKSLGNDKIDGKSCTKYLVTIKENGKTTKFFQWITTDNQFPIKTEFENGEFTQEYRNVKFGPQPNALFEIPKGFSKLGIPNFNNQKGQGDDEESEQPSSLPSLPKIPGIFGY
jgi:hypothetical protein